MLPGDHNLEAEFDFALARLTVVRIPETRSLLECLLYIYRLVSLKIMEDIRFRHTSVRAAISLPPTVSVVLTMWRVVFL
jgi:hypothetical protein